MKHTNFLTSKTTREKKGPKRKIANHFDDGKLELQYILSMPGLEEVARVWTYGKIKYGDYNFRKGMPWMKILGSCTRHLTRFICGEDIDRESGLNHMAHLCFNALIVLEYMTDHKDLDDRWKNNV